MTPLIGFAPDADITTPGLITACSNLIPYLNGMEGAPEPVTPSSTPALTDACIGAAVVTKLDDTRRIIAGTGNMLFELSSGAWVPQGQWTRSTTATYYNASGILTTAGVNIPRNTYDPATLLSVGLLNEAAGTNLMLYSEQFDNAAWTKSGSSVTANSTTAPDGNATADTLVETAVNAAHYTEQQYNGAFVNADLYTFSVYVKPAGRTFFRFSSYFAVGGAGGNNTWYNLTTKTVASTTGQSAGIVQLPNGWLRCWFTAPVDTPAETRVLVRMYLATSASVSTYLGDGVSGLYLFGVQAEKSAVPTSYIPTAATTVTRAADVPVYIGGVDTRWAITQFGDATLCSNRANVIQRSTGGTFADISGAPKAEIIFTVGAFVMALNVNDGSEKPDGWQCSAAFDDTSWTPSLATQATSGRLVATAGKLTAGMRLGEYAIAYKTKSIYLGQYVGAPTVWNWLQVPGGEAGCIGKEAICDIGGAHFFVGDDNIWIFDGTRPVPVADGYVRQFFFDNSNPSYRYRTICVFDRQKNLVWVFYPSNNSQTPDSALVYHITAKKWGVANRRVEAALNYISGGVTIDGLSAISSTIDGLASYSFDSQFWLSGGKSLSIFNTSHQLQSMTGNTVTSTMTTGDVGDDDTVSALNKIRLRYASAPGSASVQTFIQMNSGVGFTAAATGSVLDGKFDLRQSARWHKATFSFTGPVRVTHMDADLTPAGGR